MNERKEDFQWWVEAAAISDICIYFIQTRRNLVLFIFIYLAKRQGKFKDFDKRYLWQPFFAKRLFLLQLFSLF